MDQKNRTLTEQRAIFSLILARTCFLIWSIDSRNGREAGQTKNCHATKSSSTNYFGVRKNISVLFLSKTKKGLIDTFAQILKCSTLATSSQRNSNCNSLFEFIKNCIKRQLNFKIFDPSLDHTYDVRFLYLLFIKKQIMSLSNNLILGLYIQCLRYHQMIYNRLNVKRWSCEKWYRI